MLGVLELVVDLGADRLLVLVGVRLRLLALAADGLVGGLLRLGDALLDPARVLALGLREPCAPALADLARVIGPLLDSCAASTARSSASLARSAASRARRNRSSTESPPTARVQHRRGQLAAAVAAPAVAEPAASPTASAGLSALDSSHAALDGISRRPDRARSDSVIGPPIR